MAADRRSLFNSSMPATSAATSLERRIPAGDISHMSAVDLRAALGRGRLTPRDVAEALRSRITIRESQIGAFAHIDWNQVDKQIKFLRNQPVRSGPLWGVPVAIKDIVDTCDLPTAYGSDIYAGHRPAWDAAAVSRLRAAGAVILGKTVTTEFAWRKPAKTRNPHDARFSPGGSSSGSAAAVADRMVPFAIGSQTAGSIIRPAAYCGIVGFKPTYGIVSVAGVKPLAHSLDTLGVMARSVGDAALLAAVIADRSDWVEVKAPKKAPRLAFARMPEWSEVSQSALNAAEMAARTLAGKAFADRKAPKSFWGLAEAHNTILAYEAARELHHEQRAHPERISAAIRSLVDQGAKIDHAAYWEAVSERDQCLSRIDELFGDADILLAPSTPGEPPRAEESTGDPMMSRAWTLLRLPTITLPAGRSPGGMPYGLQMAARPGQDAQLIAVARWAEAKLSERL